MQITLNGKATPIGPLNLTLLVKDLGLNPTQIAVERNGEIVPKSQYDQVALQDGDAVEIVKFIGGG